MEITARTSYWDLQRHFNAHPPADLSPAIFSQYACIGIARAVLEELGGAKQARIMWVEDHNTNGDSALEMHAYVVRTEDEPEDLAFCSYEPGIRTVEYVMRKGEDLTEKILATSWDNMNI